MADTMRMQVTGMKELRDAIKALPHALAEHALKKADRAGAQVIADAMQDACPIQEIKAPGSDSLAPGQLKEDIRVILVEQDVSTRQDNIFVAEVGPKRYAYVARWVEYGHANVHGGYSKRKYDVAGNFTGERRGPGKIAEGYTPPHPFLRPAFEASRQAAQEKIVVTLRAGVKRAVRAARRK